MDDAGWLAAGASSPDEVRRYYDDLAAEYDATLADWGYTAPESAAALLLRHVAPVLAGAERPGTVLDAGCGTGLAGEAVRQAGFSGALLGIDLSPASVEVAVGRGIYDSVQLGDLQQPLEIADASVDGVLCVGVLTYVPDVAAVLSEFCRVTRPGGTVVFTQRDDLWVQRGCPSLVHRLERERRWTLLHVSPPEAYLPNHSDFGDRILARTVAARVR